MIDRRHELLDQVEPLGPDREFVGGEAGDVAAGTRHAQDEALRNWIRHLDEDDRGGRAQPLQGDQVGGGGREYDIGRQRNKLGGIGPRKRSITLVPAILDVKILAVDPSQLAQLLLPRCPIRLGRWIRRSTVYQQSNALRLLRVRRARPQYRRGRCGTQKRDDITSSHCLSGLGTMPMAFQLRSSKQESATSEMGRWSN